MDSKEELQAAHARGAEQEPEQLTTKIYYYVDDQPTPYSTEVPVPPSKITLVDFKEFINRSRSYKFYYKVMDPVLNTEVKMDILNEDDILHPNSEGRYEFFLLSDNSAPGPSSSTAATLPVHCLKQQVRHQQLAKGARPGFYPRHYSRAAVSKAKYQYDFPGMIDSTYYDEDSESEPDDSDMRVVSENEESLQSLSSTEFTSVSQQQQPPPQLHNGRYHYGGGGNNKPYWTRSARNPNRPRRGAPAKYTFLSTTLDDTEVSMALDLITVTFNMNTQLPLGMSVMSQRSQDFSGLYVHSISPSGLVALDGRIKVGYLLLDVNDIPLDSYGIDEGINFLRSTIKRAMDKRGQLKFTCARSDRSGPQLPEPANFFRLPSEPVRPIDPSAWVQHCNAMRGLNMISKEFDSQAQPSFQQSENMEANLEKQNNNFAEACGQSYPYGNNHSNTIKRGVLTLIQPNQATGASSVNGPTDTTSTVFSSNPHSGKARRKGNKSLSRAFRRLLCIRSSPNCSTLKRTKAQWPKAINGTPRRFKNKTRS